MLEIEARCEPNIPIPVTENSEFFENRSCEDLIYDYDYIIVNSCQHKIPSERNLHQQLNPFSCWLNNLDGLTVNVYNVSLSECIRT